MLYPRSVLNVIWMVYALSNMPSVHVASDYVVEVAVQSYNSLENRAHGHGGACCDPNVPGLSGDGVCTGDERCDYYFSYCLRSINTPGTDRGCPIPGDTSTNNSNDAPIDFTQPTVLGLPNPLVLPGLSPFWEGAQLYIEVMDRDLPDGDANTDDLVNSFAININRFRPVGRAGTESTAGVYRYSTITLSVTIQCAQFYYGDRCQFVDTFNQCELNSVTCSGQGECVDGTNSYTCECDPAYTGTNCQLFNYCFQKNCSERGTCRNDPSSYTCDCDPGFTGDDCEINIDDCVNVSCNGRRTCQDLINNYRCTCDPGYTGRDCEMNINECEGQDCSGNGRCVDLVNMFRCDCQPGYTGDVCETNINHDCVGVNCSGNGQCVDRENNFTCFCQSGFTGDLCSVEVQSQIEHIGGIAGGVAGALLVAIVIILLLLVAILIMKRRKTEQGTSGATDGDIETKTNIGYGVFDQVSPLPVYDYVDLTTNTESPGEQRTIEMQDNTVYALNQQEEQVTSHDYIECGAQEDIEMSSNVVYGVRDCHSSGTTTEELGDYN